MEKVKSQIEFQDRDLGPRCRGLRVEDKEGRKEVSSRTFVMGKYLAHEGSVNYSGDCGLTGDAVGGSQNSDVLREREEGGRGFGTLSPDRYTKPVTVSERLFSPRSAIPSLVALGKSLLQACLSRYLIPGSRQACHKIHKDHNHPQTDEQAGARLGKTMGIATRTWAPTWTIFTPAAVFAVCVDRLKKAQIGFLTFFQSF